MPKRILKGLVVSNKCDKTVSVEVQRTLMHAKYHKIIKKSKKYSVHDESNKCKIGDEVRIIEHSPISKTKKWMLLE